MENFINILIPVCAVSIFVALLIISKILNPKNQKKNVRINVNDIFRTEICPKCHKKMKKTWTKQIIYGSTTTRHVGYEKKAEFSCQYCKERVI